MDAQATYVSADSHVMEPATLWTERLDKTYRDRAPLVVENTEVIGVISKIDVVEFLAARS